MSKAYSEITTESNFEQFYSKWQGIIKSGTTQETGSLNCGPHHFFDQFAHMKMKSEDNNLKVVKQLQKELNDLKVNNSLHPGMPFGYHQSKEP